MWEWLWAGGALVLVGCGVAWVRRQMRYRREEAILYRKYGDLPMFEDFFKRLREERGKGKGRIG